MLLFLHSPGTLRWKDWMKNHIRRRRFITLLGGAGAAWPLAARAQQPPMPLIGLLNANSERALAPLLAIFRKTLGEAGYVEGRNVAVEYRFADGQAERFPGLVSDLVRRRVCVASPNWKRWKSAARPARSCLPSGEPRSPSDGRAALPPTIPAMARRRCKWERT